MMPSDIPSSLTETFLSRTWMSTETIHIAGRYNKYLRDLSQSPWIDKNDVRVKDSVQELLEGGFKKFLCYDKSIFASSGREDVDVRMLGKGRPFAMKLLNPQRVDEYTDETLRKIHEYINTEHRGKVGIRDLQIVSKNDVAKYLKEGQESKKKEYRALCCCSRKLTKEDIETINKMEDLCIEQMTPIRVLHRRTWATRRRTIHKFKIEPVKMDEYESVKLEILEYVFALTMLTEAGTYIKEFVHGDFGRTMPNLSSLLGDCVTDLMELDVTEVHLDWPPVRNMIEAKELSNPINKEDKMETSDAALADLYEKGYKCMQEALETPRGDSRQDLFLTSRRAFEQSSRLIESLSLYSDNETLDDVATINLKYLLVPAYLAKISISSEMHTRRLETFLKAESFIRLFLHRISQYGLGDRRVEQALKAIDGNSAGAVQSLMTANLEAQMRSRSEKIDRLNKTRQLEERLAELERRVKSGQDVDDEVTRDYYMSLIQKWITETLEDYERIIQAGLMLERGRPSGIVLEPDVAGHSIKPKSSNSLEGKTFTIVRDQLQKQAFGVGYPSLPTVSVDEFISKKINDGDLVFQEHKEIYANSLQRYAEKPDLRREQEEQSDEEHETKADKDDAEELARKRAWDEFKDENPRGSGNRYNMG